MNNLKVGLMLVALTVLLVWAGSALGGATGAGIALVLALVMNFGTYWFSDKLVIKMTGAQPVSESEAPELYAIVRSLAARAGIPMPAVYIVPDPSPNAFATGRSPERGVVAVNEGLLNLLDRQELAGVIAHELAHIKHRDTLTMAIVASIAGAVSMIANIFRFAAIFGHNDEEGGGLGGLIFALVAPLAAMLVQLGISRAREYEADRMAAELVGTGQGLKNALMKLNRGVMAVPGHVPAQAAHLCIVNPFAGLHGIAALFSTHPPVERRIAKLDALEGRLAGAVRA
jgi:heat shock protein HtpX